MAVKVLTSVYKDNGLNAMVIIFYNDNIYFDNKHPPKSSKAFSILKSSHFENVMFHDYHPFTCVFYF